MASVAGRGRAGINVVASARSADRAVSSERRLSMSTLTRTATWPGAATGRRLTKVLVRTCIGIGILLVQCAIARR